MDPVFKPLTDAAQAGDLETFRALIAAQPELVRQTSGSSHPDLLQFVAVDGGLGKIPDPARFAQVLIDAGASLPAPFVAAASVGSRELVDLFIEAGVAIEACAPWTALEETLYWANRDLGRYLFEDLGARVPSLRAAAELGRLDLMAAFFDGSGRLRQEAGPVRYPFGQAESDKAQDVLDQAFLLALKNLQYEAASLLLEHGADVNGIPPGNHEQCTPLHQAVYKDDRAMVEWLLDRGAVTTIEDPRFNHTAIGWAEHFENTPLATLLRRHGANPA